MGAARAGVLHVFDRVTGAVQHFERAGSGFVWSPDGRALVAERRSASRDSPGPAEWLARFDVESGEAEDWLLPEDGCRYFLPAWSSLGLLVRHQCSRSGDLTTRLMLFDVPAPPP